MEWNELYWTDWTDTRSLFFGSGRDDDKREDAWMHGLDDEDGNQCIMLFETRFPGMSVMR